MGEGSGHRRGPARALYVFLEMGHQTFTDFIRVTSAANQWMRYRKISAVCPKRIHLDVNIKTANHAFLV